MDTMRVDGQAESALSEAANYFAGTEVGPAPTTVDNVHAENVPQGSEATVGSVSKIKDAQTENAFADAASHPAETTVDPTHAENVPTDTANPNLEAANVRQECQDKESQTKCTMQPEAEGKPTRIS